MSRIYFSEMYSFVSYKYFFEKSLYKKLAYKDQQMKKLLVLLLIWSHSIVYANSYYISNSSQPPWGSDAEYVGALNQVLGAGQWTYQEYSGAASNISNIFLPSTSIVYLQGSDGLDGALNSFLSDAGRQQSILNWVTAGGGLIIQSAGNSGVSINFANVTLVKNTFSSYGYVTSSGLSSSTSTITYTQRWGSAIGHNIIVPGQGVVITSYVNGSSDLSNVANDTGSIVAKLNYGSGSILFSGLTNNSFHKQSDASSALGTDANTWLLNILSGWLTYYSAPTAQNTQSALEISVSRLKAAYNIQSTALVNGLNYDCQIFDVNKICLSTGGRYSNNHGSYGNTTSALLIGAYRLNKNVRVGAWIDQNLSANTTSGINLGNSKPLVGVFGAWSENPNGEGYEVKVSAGYGDKDLTVTRDVIGTSEPGTGNSRVNSQAISSVSSYGFRINNELLASPYIGIRYSRISSNGYTEVSTSDVTVPLTYNKLTQENIALLAGLKISAKLDPQTTLVASAGIEQNLKNRSGQYSATGVDGLTSIEFNSNPQKTRATASVGAYYDLDKTQRVSINGIYREETFSPTATTSLLATYTVGF